MSSTEVVIQLTGKEGEITPRISVVMMREVNVKDVSVQGRRVDSVCSLGTSVGPPFDRDTP